MSPDSTPAAAAPGDGGVPSPTVLALREAERFTSDAETSLGRALSLDPNDADGAIATAQATLALAAEIRLLRMALGGDLADVARAIKDAAP